MINSYLTFIIKQKQENMRIFFFKNVFIKVAHVSVLTLAPATVQFPNVELPLTIRCSIIKKKLF